MQNIHHIHIYTHPAEVTIPEVSLGGTINQVGLAPHAAEVRAYFKGLADLLGFSTLACTPFAFPAVGRRKDLRNAAESRRRVFKGLKEVSPLPSIRGRPI